jgi:hypothetical protein
VLGNSLKVSSWGLSIPEWFQCKLELPLGAHAWVSNHMRSHSYSYLLYLPQGPSIVPSSTWARRLHDKTAGNPATNTKALHTLEIWLSLQWWYQSHDWGITTKVSKTSLWEILHEQVTVERTVLSQCSCWKPGIHPDMQRKFKSPQKLTTTEKNRSNLESHGSVDRNIRKPNSERVKLRVAGQWTRYQNVIRKFTKTLKSGNELELWSSQASTLRIWERERRKMEEHPHGHTINEL